MTFVDDIKERAAEHLDFENLWRWVDKLIADGFELAPAARDEAAEKVDTAIREGRRKVGLT